MAFNSGYTCDKCGETWEMSGMSAHEVPSITHLRRFAKSKGWSVGKKLLLCNKCRKQKRANTGRTR